ncbi:MAG: ABC transporter permease [Candidatus Omnitrophica bacterium]|nr:ABC transporter permease [Candidatus Omnitrophota bacterium]
MIPFEVTLAWRYFVSKKRHPFIGVISAIAVLGVAVGVAALIVVIAVMSGFEADLTERVVGTYAHAVIEPEQPTNFDESFLESVRSSSPDVSAVAAFVEGQAVFQRNKVSRGVLVKGARRADEESVTRIADYLKEGAYPAEGAQEILIGDVMGMLTGCAIGDEVTLISPYKQKRLRLTISGFYHSGMYDYDANLVYLPLDLAEDAFGLEGAQTAVAIKYTDPAAAIRDRQALQERIGFQFYVRTWRDMNAALFEALELERAVMFVILGLIVLVACFNIVGTLTLLVMDKTKDIGILKALGASGPHLVRIFVLVGYGSERWGPLWGSWPAWAYVGLWTGIRSSKFPRACIISAGCQLLCVWRTRW